MNQRNPPPGEAIPIVRDALAAARAASPDEALLARVAAKVTSATAPHGGQGGGDAGARGSPPSPASPLPAPAAAPPSMLSGALIGAALGALGSGAVLLRPADPVGAPRYGAVLPSQDGEHPHTTLATEQAEAPPRSVEARRAEVPPVTAPAHVPPRASGAIASAAAAAAPGAPPPAPPASAEGAPAAVAPSSGEGYVAGAPVPETEIELLQRAQGALAASPAQALALTREHTARFPGGAFSQEREVVAIQALLRLGQREEARARGARFVATYPGSGYRRRIEALLGP